MDTNSSLSEDALLLALGQAEITFGSEAIEAVIAQAKWAEKYPETITRLKSDDVFVKYQTVLPADMVYEIAGRKECIYDFFASPDGERLYANWRHKRWPEPRAIDIEIETKGYAKINNQQALLTYGAYCLFMAVDNIYGRKGERGGNYGLWVEKPHT